MNRLPKTEEKLFEENKRPAETLDPADWGSFRALAHQMMDAMIDHLSSLRDKPAWQAMPPEVKAGLKQPLPLQPEGMESVCQEFIEKVLPYPNGNLHPRFWGWVQGTGTPLAMLADMLAAGMNPHLSGFNQAPVLVEQQVLAWLIEMMGLPATSSGILTSGGTMANIIGLVVARNAKAGFDLRSDGLQSANHAKLIMYGSSETHSWAETAAELLGLGRNCYRRAPVNEDFRVDINALRAMIEADRRAGAHPFCVVGTAGTVNTGAIDDLTALAQLCRAEDLWFHIDGAFGALARLSPSLQPLVRGIEEADSLAFDLHKWLYLPFEIGTILIRDAQAHYAAFTHSANYLAETPRGVIAGGLPFAERGLELTRGFKALKAWMSFKAHGINAFSRLIEQNVEQARYLAQLIEKSPHLELMSPVNLNVVCFRFRGEIVDENKLNRLNEELLLRIQESGIAVPSSTRINQAFVLRVAIVNHRSRFEDFDLLVNCALEIGAKIAHELL
jgi:glutamate/tyrosine decarboxylase-like PLP-dependent enzyme